MLSIEMYWVQSRSSPEIMNEIFQLGEDNHHNFRQVSQFKVPHVNSVFDERKSVSYNGT